MTDKYPLLTEENVYHWYWECDPAYSMKDIADEVGCSLGCIQRFMISRKIPRRSTTDANLNRYKDPEKLKAFLRSMQDPLHKKKVSEIRLKLMEDPHRKKITFNALNKAHEMCIGKTQRILLQILTISKKISGNELNRLSVIEPSSNIYRALKDMNRRGFIILKKIKKRNLTGNLTIQSEYSLTEKGKVFIQNFPLEDSIKIKIETELEAIRNNDNNQKSTELRHIKWLKSFEESQKFYVGKTQLSILLILVRYGPKTTRDIGSYSDVEDSSITTIRSSLARLNKRDLVSIVIDKNTNNKKKPYLYDITGLGKQLLIWKKKY